jgi:drug/metabolite transporter, DME family
MLLGAAAMFSTGGAAIKGTSFAGFELAGLRSGVAVLAFLVFLPAARARPHPRELLVALAYAAKLTAFVLANKLTTSAHTIFLQSTAPLYVLLLAPLLLRERIRARDLLLLGAIAGGIWLLFQAEQAPLASARDPALGNRLALLSGFTWALTMIGLRWL